MHEEKKTNIQVNKRIHLLILYKKKWNEIKEFGYSYLEVVSFVSVSRKWEDSGTLKEY